MLINFENEMTREQKERLDYLNNQIETSQGLTEQEYRELEKLQALERLDQATAQIEKAKAQLKEAEKANRRANFSLGFSVFVLVFSIAVLIWVLLT